ncbi:PREDICTED: uncharacterized protein LOC101294134 isoform X2 [Fragaria vesca subsp. vesca]|uniref:uncharacterized protein LOC101294134 isoform X2 n=1 Tax=Fragaria vesca subsp. vesca TaxID=101020 RepID=UPI0002C2FF42|nr:PREDICTED: uncharacterized protein LOC101294134 isoform X2 [Fragaria vesca subsp. vesca]
MANARTGSCQSQYQYVNLKIIGTCQGHFRGSSVGCCGAFYHLNLQAAKICRLIVCVIRFLSPYMTGYRIIWFLAVADMLNGVCEIWDSAPEDSAKTRRHDFAFAAFRISYLAGSPRHCRNEDSGVYLMRNMKFYRQCWYEGYNSGDQRVHLALEIVNDPRNEIFEQMCSAAAEETRDNMPATEVPVLCRGEDGSLATTGIKFNARRSRR